MVSYEAMIVIKSPRGATLSGAAPPDSVASRPTLLSLHSSRSQPAALPTASILLWLVIFSVSRWVVEWNFPIDLVVY